LGVYADNGAADAGAYGMQIPIHLRIVCALVRREVKPRGRTSRQDCDYSNKQRRPAVTLEKGYELCRLFDGSGGLRFEGNFHFKPRMGVVALHARTCLAQMSRLGSVVRYRLRLRLL